MTASVQSQLEMSYASAETIAAEYPQYATQITAAAKESFLAGDQYAYIAGIIAILIGAVLVFFKYPKRDAEGKLEATFHAEDMAAMAARSGCQVNRPIRTPTVREGNTLDSSGVFPSLTVGVRMGRNGFRRISMELSSYFAYLASFITVGSFVIIDLIAATTNALNGALLAQRPDYYKGKQWTVVGIIILAIFGGIGGGVSRDMLLNKIPGALTNPWYLILCILAGAVGLLISFKGGQKFRETFSSS